LFFDRFREAAARLPAGLLRPGPAADPAAIAAAEDALGAPLPADYASFLRSFDGADLFHESIVIAGVGADTALSLRTLNPAPSATPVSWRRRVGGRRSVRLRGPRHLARARRDPRARRV